MLVYRKKRPRHVVQAPLTSLIDIVFLLLIYFLLTTNFMVEEGIKVKLPQAKASAPQTEQTITIYVDRAGKAFLKQQEVSIAELFGRLKDLIGMQQDQMVVVKADQSVVLAKVVNVMDVAKAAGAGRLCLATEKPL